MSHNREGEEAPLLVVDLDGALLKTDLLYEGVAALMRQKPHSAVLLLPWLLRGRTFVKAALAERVTIDAALLPYNEELLAFLREAHHRGTVLVLATASHESLAEQVAAHLGIFSHVLASTASFNCKGQAKLDALRARFPGARFDYVGDSPHDAPLFEAAERRYAAGMSPAVLRKLKKRFEFARTFDCCRPRLMPVLKELRCHQYAKNLLLFVPLVMAHELHDLGRITSLVLAFAAFSLCASAVYILNDMLDLDSDRRHPLKRKRPLASGALPLLSAFQMIPALLAASFSLASAVNPRFLSILFAYFFTTTAYSLVFKRIVIADGILLACLYTLRIVAGGIASDVPVSEWLQVFSIFFFLSLAFAKRYAELYALPLGKNEKAAGRGYMSEDAAAIANFGTASGYLSVLVLALYINSSHVSSLYTHPEGLWLICPLLLYWISRVWLLSYRGRMHEDPVVFAFSDRVSYLIGLVTALCLFLSS